MVNTLLTLIKLVIPDLADLYELAAIVLLAVAFGIWWGTPAVLCVVGVSLLVKSIELDLRAGQRRGGG